ncbi:hypothetical protein DESUT3_34990 [Desulfuromonas versatilis]|uniref:Bacterial transcriptional activator domain-containing protein n=1 Tax=Desulfuromonas versatilis TaxID=2802975 RepID=A0ABM8HWW1_9BACT|nr:BTAD domain-containing putative transcriptional regulator [Desulfuromonas versatilis]BCR06430.1 hypothetical protein DESUT3_34990 [Desulfuromonas versatilis]
MEHWFDRIRARIPKNKFYPPGYATGACLVRQHLLNTRLKAGSTSPKLIYVEGQAGQGKSTLAMQYLSESTAPYVWYQLGPEDQDPVFLAAALLAGLMEKLPEFSSPLLEQMLAAGEASAAEAPTLARVLAKDLAGSLSGELSLVFDDLHLLGQASFSLCFLQSLAELSPRALRLIILSREKIPDGWEPLVDGGRGAMIGNSDLALDKTEIASLFNEIFRIPLSPQEVQDLHAATEGWIAGLILAGHGFQGTVFHYTTIPAHPPRSLLKRGGILEFFKTEIFSRVPGHLRRTLYKLALLDEIPLSLARELAEVPDVEEVLETLRRRNFFLRGLDEGNRVLGFHALFREFLQEQAAAELSGEELSGALLLAGRHYLDQGDPVKALRYVLPAGDFSLAEAILRRTGMALMAVNRVITLKGFLQQIPEQVVFRHAWLSFYAGVICMDHDPMAALPHLDRARECFADQGDDLGEMLALAQLMHYHVSIDARHNLGRPYLGRLEELFARYRDRLDAPGQIRIAQAIAGGHCFFDYDMGRTDTYSRLALELSERLGLDNHTATTRAIRCYRHAFVGNWRALREEIEQALPYLLNPRVSAQAKLTTSMTQASWLILEGDFRSYRRAKVLLRGALEKSLVAQSVATPFLLIYDAYLALAQGDLQQLRRLAEDGLALEGVGASPHHRSQFLHFEALARAWDGDGEGALRASELSRRLRIEVGPGRFDALNQMVLGAAFTRLQRPDEAHAMLERACEVAQAYADEHLLSGALLHRAYLRMQLGETGPAREDLARGLALMKKNGYVYFFGWIPEVMQALLQEAARSGIEAEFARDLAAERLDTALLNDGGCIPLLEIRAFGGLNLALGGETRVRETDLSPAQRQLLALVISAPGRRIAQEQLQLLLWPDSSAEKSRSTFDTLLSRLRKTLEPLLHPVPVKHYLSLQKGILCLENCRVDAEAFVAAARGGLRHAQREAPWQGAIALDLAVELWRGPYLGGLAVDESVDRLRAELEGLYFKVVGLWARLRAGAGLVSEAIEVASAALKLDPTNHSLVQLLYGLYTQAGNPVEAGKVLKAYREQLEREEYSPAEIGQALESLWAPAP